MCENPSTYACEIDKYLKCIIGDSVVSCNVIIDVVPKLYDESTNFNEKKGNL